MGGDLGALQLGAGQLGGGEVPSGGFNQAAILGDLTTLIMGEYVPELKAASPSAVDVDTLIRDHSPTVYATVDDDDDRNTILAIYISST